MATDAKADATKPAPEPSVEEVWTYLGKRYDDQDERLYHAVRPPDGETLLYAKPVTGSTVGGRYRVHVTRTQNGEKTSCRVTLNRYSYEGLDDDADEVNKWAMDHAAAVATHESRLVEKKDGRGRLKALTLEEVARRYRRLPPTRARGLLATVLSIITSGVGGV